jgi:hypothetical protein
MFDMAASLSLFFRSGCGDGIETLGTDHNNRQQSARLTSREQVPNPLVSSQRIERGTDVRQPNRPSRVWLSGRDALRSLSLCRGYWRHRARPFEQMRLINALFWAKSFADGLAAQS